MWCCESALIMIRLISDECIFTGFQTCNALQKQFVGWLGSRFGWEQTKRIPKSATRTNCLPRFIMICLISDEISEPGEYFWWSFRAEQRKMQFFRVADLQRAAVAVLSDDILKSKKQKSNSFMIFFIWFQFGSFSDIMYMKMYKHPNSVDPPPPPIFEDKILQIYLGNTLTFAHFGIFSWLNITSHSVTLTHRLCIVKIYHIVNYTFITHWQTL